MAEGGMMKRLTFVLSLAMAGVMGCGDFDPSSPDPSGGDPAKAQALEGRYIVTVAPNARPNEVARGHGIAPDFVYQHVLNGFAARIPPQAHHALLRNPYVERIDPDHVVTAAATIQEGATWGLDRIDQRGSTLDGLYTYEYKGSGVTVYIADTGIRYSHQEFEGRAVPGFDVFGSDGSDCHGHGTHVAGTVGSRTYGVAKDVRLVSVRVLNCNGSGSASGVIAGIDWAAGDAARPAVLNMSLGGVGNASVDEAVRQAAAAGITVVAAAGNHNDSACWYSPARSPDAITTAAMDPDGSRSAFSNYGDCVDLFAPGRFIQSTANVSDAAVADMAGTSVAAPHVAGAAALVLEEYPDASPDIVTSVILSRVTRRAVTNANTRNNDLLYTLPSDGSGGNKGGGANQSPDAAFSYSCTALVCSFIDQSTDPDGQVVAWSWSFGDGSASTDQHPARTYDDPGTYAVTLTVTDNEGATSSASQTITVQSPSSTPPAADFAFECEDLSCSFTDLSTAAEGALEHWEWDFGDGSIVSTTTGPSNPTHVYAVPGEYPVRLRVTDAGGGIGEAIREVVVEGIALVARSSKNRGYNHVDLWWSGASGDSVRILQDGVEVLTAPNTGHYTYVTLSRGKASLAFQVCEMGSARCSAEVQVDI
jgi:subtilisin family serine protease